MAAAPVESGALRALGSCRCGAVRLSVPVARDVPWRVCHCPHCRRAHGAAWSVLVPPVGGARGVECTARASALRPGVDSRCLGLGPDGESVRRSFCAVCFSTVLVTVATPGGRTSLIAAGMLGNGGLPRGFAPSFTEIYTEKRAPFYPPAPQSERSKRPRGIALSGSCSCGACSFEAPAWEGSLQHCHCGICRQMSGSAFQTWAAVRARSLRWTARGVLRKLRTSAHASREVCSECGTALTMLYDGQRGVAWVAAAVFDRGAFPQGVAVDRAQHICVAYASRWSPPTEWPSDGLHRIRGVYDGDSVPLFEEGWDVRSADIRERLTSVGDASDDDEMQAALSRSLLEASARPTHDGFQGGLPRASSEEQGVAIDGESGDEELQRALALSAAEFRAGPAVVDAESPCAVAAEDAPEVRRLCEFAGCAPEAAREALARSGGDAEAAATLLLTEPARAEIVTPERKRPAAREGESSEKRRAGGGGEGAVRVRVARHWGPKRIRGCTAAISLTSESDDGGEGVASTPP